MSDEKVKLKEEKLLDEISELYERLKSIRERKKSEVEEEGRTDGNGEAKPRILLVSRTLPIRLHRVESKMNAEFLDIDWFDESMHLFATVHEKYPCVWLGTLSYDMESGEQMSLKETLLHEHRYYPVLLTPKKENLFYYGFCNTVMWPLFHSSPPTTEEQIISHELDVSEDTKDMEKTWQAYVAVNQAFADAIREIYQDGDVIWIQDYHFTLLPQMIRNLLPNAKIRIGFFLHIPFPSSELYRILTHREDILTGMLGADLIGFQTYEYARHFQSAVVRILGLEGNYQGIQIDNHFARVAICPVGIDPERFRLMFSSDGVLNCIRQVDNKFYGKKIVLGVNRLDPTSGLVHKFLAIEELLTKTPELANELVFVEIVLPNASTSFAELQLLEAQIDGLVSKINSQHSYKTGARPIHYLTREVPRDELLALFCSADVLITSPIRDGMNLVPFEYVVCRDAHGADGCVVLSEFAGSATSLGGAFLVNPWDTEGFAATILQALDLDEEERIAGHNQMCQYANTFTATQWADVFLEQLNEKRTEIGQQRELTPRDISGTYSFSKHRLLFLNLSIAPTDELIALFQQLTKDPANLVVVVSSKSKSIMEKWFENVPKAILAAEYGVYIRLAIDQDWICSLPHLDLSWFEHVLPLLEYYNERTPGAYIERKDSSVTWQYRGCDSDHGSWQATELQITLRELTRTMPIAVIPGDKMIEIRPRTLNKGTLFEFVWEKLPNETIDFVFVISPGSDRTDEDLFSILVPPPIDLQPYCKQLEIEGREESCAEPEASVLPQNPLDALLLKPTVKKTGSVSADAVERFPHKLVHPISSSTDTQSKFIPRKDFPPSFALFKALKRKYGSNYGMFKLPDTPAACWALVLPPTARDKLKGVEAMVETSHEEVEKARFPSNTFVCTIGRKLSQAPYFVQDPFAVLEEMAQISS